MSANKINILNNGTFDIATGRHRRETSWKNKEMLWSELVEKLSITHRTAETISEYLAAKKTRQDEIKDVGGFVGGYLNGGRRKASNVAHRQLITLDLDFAHSGLWDDFTLLYDNAAALYSTHKHTADKPRYRLILPLDREVFADEYTAIARRIAGVLGIELFDHTTFQPERLMYWPSTAKDGVYEFQYQDGSWISADEILNTYRDWHDTSEWPVSDRESSIISKGILKQGDPLEKIGIVGAFCRTYTITEVIELFLSDVYEPTDFEDRYTYNEGSTAAGLVIYEDKYAYSHHGTDPVSGKLCNAFDLVRLHKFGLKDEDVRSDTPNNKLPSYTAMQDLATKDPKVIKQVISEKLDNAKSDFSDLLEIQDLEETATEDDSWKEKLDIDRKGNVYNTIDNVCLVLENDPYFKNRIAYDDFEKCEVAIKNLPWRKITHQTRRLTDKDDANIRHYLEKKYGISTALKIKDALGVLSVKTSFHPVRNYLNSLKWDGEARAETLFIDYQGALDSEYVRAVTRKVLVAAVKRIFEPGTKFDYVLTLVGQQGLKKSSLIGKLGKQWFSDSFSTIKGKESFEQLQGVWLVEIAELAGLAKAEIEAIKHFITKREDRYRVAFGYRTENFPRQCVFFATTNKRDFLRDPTGDRRYWPILVHEQIPTKDVFKHLTDYEVNQIWAEAMQLYRAGETIYLNSDLETIAKEIQKEHTEEHPWTGIILQYLDTKLPEDWNKRQRFDRMAWLQDDDLQAEGTMYREHVCVQEIWIEALSRRDSIDDRSATAIRNIMRNMAGWKEEPKPMRYNIYGIQRKGFIRTEIPEKVLEETVTNAVTNVLQKEYDL
jgi:putative DNA primase/helicase